jgi:hypothetical protein
MDNGPSFLFSNIRTRVINGLLGKEVEEAKVQARQVHKGTLATDA